MSAIAILGGTFDPVHNGHLRAALEVREQFGLDEIRLLPAGTPPHRPAPEASAGHRLAMLQQVAAVYPGFRVDDREIRRAGYSYMVDTLEEIRAEAGAAPVLLAIGQDAANALDRWHEWERLFDLAHLVVMCRPDSRAEYGDGLSEQMERRRCPDSADLLSSPAGRVCSMAITQLDVSATAIREAIRAGRSPAFLVPGSVRDYLREQDLYR
ncbi:MAG: nicotinate-nucleotide adenylyltransferase [Xanthomonadales bacterium]|nr:nicotinate-nucleotide adenylyltransferase [Gammaproteobacteria bacterium]NNK36959.1 nicotinate-nucleotide adenylyltransferase [Xanthomonadales bacterium]